MWTLYSGDMQLNRVQGQASGNLASLEQRLRSFVLIRAQLIENLAVSTTPINVNVADGPIRGWFKVADSVGLTLLAEIQGSSLSLSSASGSGTVSIVVF